MRFFDWSLGSYLGSWAFKRNFRPNFQNWFIGLLLVRKKLCLNCLTLKIQTLCLYAFDFSNRCRLVCLSWLGFKLKWNLRLKHRLVEFSLCSKLIKSIHGLFLGYLSVYPFEHSHKMRIEQLVWCLNCKFWIIRNFQRKLFITRVTENLKFIC